MKIGLLIYGSLDTLSGGYLYDRKLVDYLQGRGDTVEIISLPWRNYAAHLTDNLRFRLPSDLDLLIQDELNHPSLLSANRRPHPYPVISLVHHLRCSEQRSDLGIHFYRLVEKRFLNSVDGFIFNSYTTKRVVSELVENGIPDIVAYPPTDRFGHPITEDEVMARVHETEPLRIIFLGNVIPRKGLDVLVTALRLQTEQTNFHLDVIGRIDIDQSYASAVFHSAYDLPDPLNLDIHGPLDNEELIAKMKAAHVLVVPSSYEGFGIVYLEGMAFGLPAIGTTAGAAHEIISNGETGYLINPDDAKTLAEHLSRLANDRDLLAGMSIKALKRYHQQPSWIETAERIHVFLHGMV